MTREWSRPRICLRRRFLQIRLLHRSGRILLQIITYRVSHRDMMSDEVLVVYVDEERGDVVLDLEGMPMQLF